MLALERRLEALEQALSKGQEGEPTAALSGDVASLVLTCRSLPLTDAIAKVRGVR